MSAWFLHAENVWNPLLRYPRNAPCFCRKGNVKAKKCCLPTVVWYIPKKNYFQASEAVKLVRERWQLWKKKRGPRPVMDDLKSSKRKG